ncbi:tyrosine-protein phosphatase [Spirosoma arcticum]
MKNILFLLLSPAIALAQAPDQTDTLVYNAHRAVTLEGASNFRDLGGYPAAEGKTVKWGRIYRSADVSKLTDADMKTLEARHIATVCDLRGPDELKTSPDRLPTGVTYVNLPAGSETLRANTNYAAMNRDSMMRVAYTRTDHLKAKYKPMFDQLLMLDGEKALMFHCTAGKDRTGMGAALVLSALGVDNATILKDYVATDVYWKQGRERVAQMMQQGGAGNAQMAKMLAADPAYLTNFFTTIDQKYGSMTNFLTTEMELTPEKLTTLRTKYLQ